MADYQVVHPVSAPPERNAGRRVGDVVGTAVRCDCTPRVVQRLIRDAGTDGDGNGCLRLTEVRGPGLAQPGSASRWLGRGCHPGAHRGRHPVSAGPQSARLVRPADRLRRAGGLGVGLRGDGDAGWSDLDPRVGAGEPAMLLSDTGNVTLAILMAIIGGYSAGES